MKGCENWGKLASNYVGMRHYHVWQYQYVIDRLPVLTKTGQFWEEFYLNARFEKKGVKFGV